MKINNLLIKFLCCTALLYGASSCVTVNRTAAGDNVAFSSDNGDGTYTNPVIKADYPDPDIIRVEDNYYMVSSSFVGMPGIPICHSKDLINWEIIGHAYDSITFQPQYRMEGGKTAYSRICWAPSFKYYNGEYYIGVNIKDDGFVMYKSRKPEGPYTQYKFDKTLYDPGFFIDDDGKKYVTHGKGKIYLTRLNDDGTGVLDPNDNGTLIITAPKGYEHLFEGCHTYKRNGWYYIFNPALGYDGVQMISRSRNLYGPYETKVLIDDDINYAGAGVHQGGYVETLEGESWAFTFQDRDYLGRCLMLYPMKWVDDWPVVGPEGKPGKGVVTYRKPAVRAKSELKFPQHSDEFESECLSAVWEFNHVPLKDKWSLSERPGFFRIHAHQAPYFGLARNTLTQKVTGYESTVTVLLDINGLKPGDFAGSGIMGSEMLHLGVHRKVDGDWIEFRKGNWQGEKVMDCTRISSGKVYLRTEIKKDGTQVFSYSLDDKTYNTFGKGNSGFWGFLGIRHTLCCFRLENDGAGGFADFDYFRLEGTSRGNHYDALEYVDFDQYDFREGLTLVRKKKSPVQYFQGNGKEGWLRFNNLYFDTVADKIVLSVDSADPDAVIEIHRENPEGELLGTCHIGRTAVEGWNTMTFPLSSIEKGTHTLCFVFRMDTGCKVKGFRFIK